VPGSYDRPERALGDQAIRVRPRDLAWRRAGDEIVVLDLAASAYHALNVSAALLWERMAGGATASELTRVLVSSFGLTSAAATQDVSRFLDGCATAGLIEIGEP
jgi:hypothetical protein